MVIFFFQVLIKLVFLCIYLAPSCMIACMNYEKAQQKLELLGQNHLLQKWESLSGPEKENLLQQIAALNPRTFFLQRNLLKEKGISSTQNHIPFREYSKTGSEEDKKLGLKLLEEGKIGALIVAGGEGTRLGFNGPKGCFPISNVQKKTLYQLFAEKTAAASKMCGRPLSLAIMTSPNNHKETVSYFIRNNYFGLEKNQVDFFSQESLPYLDQKGDMFLETPSTIAMGPNGNGSALYHFFESGLWEKWHRKGIEIIHFILIDNALAEPFDPELAGYHRRHNCNATIKAIERTDPLEHVGTIVRIGDRVHVVEYTEMSQKESEARDADGGLRHRCANISLFCFDMELAHRTAIDDSSIMPYHLAFKAASYLDSHGITVKSGKPIAWKYEKFIFDLLPFAPKVGCLLYPRQECFAPLKNKEGKDSQETVQKLLLDNDRRLWRSIAGTAPPETVIELSQQFHYPTRELYQRWKGKPFPPSAYVE